LRRAAEELLGPPVDESEPTEQLEVSPREIQLVAQVCREP
jgi:hypothetical protein